ncbi:MAG: Rieske (2Fe-2S) protein [Fimbriimonas sp.]|nr:Rieske (2Fe-2S) protein [Fimbriimonas sp.]
MSKEPTAVLPTEPDENGVTRAQFIKVAVGGMCLAYAAAIGYPVYRYLNSPVEREAALAAIKDVTLAGADKLELGSVLLFKFGPYPSMLIHHRDGKWVAFDAVCSHLGCTVQYHPDLDKIVCACHGGVYDAYTGENVSGPPPKPLRKFNVKVGSGSVLVSRV